MTRTTILLYVTNPEASAGFYARLLSQEPVEASPTFVQFVLPSGLALSLWARHTIIPAPTAAGGGCEIGFRVDSPAHVAATHAEWQAKGAEIVLTPTDLDFGCSFMAVDPDGNRLRVYALTEDQ